jgi:hypothetical protein
MPQRAAVPCDVDYVDLDNDDGRSIPSVCVTCSVCGHSTESYGTSSASVRRCLALLRDECPRDEQNVYAAEVA